MSSRARAYVVIGMLLLGVALGAVVQRVTAATIRTSDLPSLPLVAEPVAAASIARAVVQDDPKALGDQLNAQALQRLGQGLAPIVSVRTVRFVGATDVDGHTIAAYVASGRDERGVDVIVGFTLHVEDNAVVGVN